MKLSLKNIVWKEGDFYVAQCLNVEVNSFGETKQEALSNLKEAIELYFEDSGNNQPNKVYYLPSILSSWSLNKQLPKLKYDPRVYGNADELNKDLW